MTNNGFDSRWISAINGVLADREVDLRVTDLTHTLWDTFIGPMVDHIEEQAELPLLDRDFEIAGDNDEVQDTSVIVTYEPSADLLIDALTIAAEGGINYWASFLEIQRETAEIPRVLYVKIGDAEDPDAPVRELHAHDLARGFAVALDPTFKLRNDLRAAILAALVQDDASEIDADAADVLVQAAIFDHLVYG